VFIEAKYDGSGGDDWSYKSYKAKVKSPTNQHPVFYRPDALPVAQAQPTVEFRITSARS